MTFHEYVCRRRGDDNLIGDFIDDTKRVRDFPDVKSWGELKAALFFIGAWPDDDLLKAAKAVWTAYRASERRAAIRAVRSGAAG